MRPRRVAVVAAVIVVLAALGLASAASLGVTSRNRTSTSATAPCTGAASALPVSPTNAAATQFNAVQVTLPPGCGQRQVQVALRSGTTNRTSAATTITGTGTVPMSGTYTASTTLTIWATVDGWDQPITWSYETSDCRVPGNPDARCDSVITVFTGSKPGGGSFTYYDVAVTTDSTTPVPWEVTIRTSHPNLPAAPTRLGNSTLDGYNDGVTTWAGTGPANDVRRVSNCSTAPASITVAGRVAGPVGNSFETVVAGRTRLFSVVLNYNQVPYYDLFAPGCTVPTE